MTTAAMHGRGRPLRFLLIVMLVWAGGRIAMTQDWGVDTPHLAPRLVASASGAALLPITTGAKQVATPHAAAQHVRAPIEQPAIPQIQNIAVGGGTMNGMHLLDYLRFSIAFASRAPAPAFAGGPEPIADIPGRGMPMALPDTAFTQPVAAEKRLSGSAWLFWRDAGGGALAAGAAQLGGAQAGARIAYALMPDRPERLALYTRVTSALRRPYANEAALGLALQPVARVPVRLTIERRANIGDGGRNAFAVGIVGGYGPAPVAGAMTLEAYGQAGLVGMNHRDSYVDGKLSMMHPLPGVTPVAAGFSLSGGAQPHVARLDIGPQIAARLRLGTTPARLTAEWRERIAGDARPGSGVALTLAADF